MRKEDPTRFNESKMNLVDTLQRLSMDVLWGFGLSVTLEIKARGSLNTVYTPPAIIMMG